MDVCKQLRREADYNEKLAQFWLGMENLAVNGGCWLLNHNFGSAANAASKACDLFSRKCARYQDEANNLNRMARQYG